LFTHQIDLCDKRLTLFGDRFTHRSQAGCVRFDGTRRLICAGCEPQALSPSTLRATRRRREAFGREAAFVPALLPILIGLPQPEQIFVKNLRHFITPAARRADDQEECRRLQLADAEVDTLVMPQVTAGIIGLSRLGA
jgi:hypothetical protein